MRKIDKVLKAADKKLSDKFKNKLTTTDGRTLKWFYQNKVIWVCELTYSGMAQQLNGFARISEPVRNEIEKYMSVS